ncbi:MAG: class B sortase [Christensenellaceae bacterium]|nr:class B sortase [Christensenellaceae bacterium]
MKKNKKRLMGIILFIFFALLCLLILWEHYQEAKQVRTFTALIQMVEEQKLIDKDMDGCDAFECNMPTTPESDLEKVSGQSLSLLLPKPSMMVASAAPLSVGSFQRTGTYDNRFLVTQDTLDKRKVLPQYTALHAQNPDFFGWIRIEGTKVNYPVMFSPQEPERYLHKDFYGNYAKYGVPFVDGVTDVEHSRNLLIHGHNARSGILFGDLDKFLKKSFWEEHRYIHFDTLYEERVYEIVEVCRTRIPGEGEKSFQYYDYVNIWNDTTMNQYIQNLSNITEFSTTQILAFPDTLLTLSTCAYHEKNGRLLIIASRIL